MKSIKRKGLQALLVAGLTAMVATPIALAGADGPAATGSAKANPAKQLEALVRRSTALTELTTALADQVAALEEQTTAFEKGLQVPFQLGGFAGGDLTGEYPKPIVAPAAVRSPEIVDNSVLPLDIGDGAVDQFNFALGGVGSPQIADGSIAAADLGEPQMFINLGNFIVQPNETRPVSVSCPPGSRLLGGGHEWAGNENNNLSIISSGPDFTDPNRTWGVQARVDAGGVTNTIFASVLCLAD